MKNKGFSLLEMCVSIAILGIMISIGVPKIRNYTAIAKNTKAVSILENVRTASELYYSETGMPAFSTIVETPEDIRLKSGLEKLKKFLDNKTYKILSGEKIATIPIGVSKGSKDGDFIYGGSIKLTTFSPYEKSKDNKIGRCDGVSVWFSPMEGRELDHNGTPWADL